MTAIDQLPGIETDLLRNDTALAEAQAQVQSERRRYRELFEAVPEGLLMTSVSGEILEMNSAGARLLQVRPSGRKPQQLFDYLPEGETEEVRRAMDRLGERTRVIRCAIRMKPRRGDLFNADVTVTWLRCDDHSTPQLRWMVRQVSSPASEDSLFRQACEELREAHASVEDLLRRRLADLEETNRRLESQISERRRIEDEIVNRGRELERRLEKRTAQYQDSTKAQNSLARFLGDICAHQLRELDDQTRQVLERWDHSLPPEGRKQVGLVLHKTRGLHDLLESISGYAQTTRQALERQTIDTAVMVQEVFDTLSPGFGERCIEVRIGDLLECEADPAMLRLVFQNLIGNALKFTRSREAAVVEVQCRRTAKEIVWSICDNGVGFQKEQAHRLFQPFQRLHRTQGYEGAGVGLATAHRIISRHDGRIWAEPNSDGVGATFHFALPSSR